MDLLKDNYYVLSHEFRFRREKNRCIGYTVDDFFKAPDNLVILHPREVIFLMLFDGSRTVIDVERDYKTLFCKHDQEFKAILLYNNLVERSKYSELLKDKSNYTEDEINIIESRYNPNEFLIPQSEIKLDFNNLRLDKPLSINMNITTVCGFKCLYCYHPLMPVNEYISLERLTVIFHEMKRLGIESILFTGGDPLLRSDIDEVMIAAKEAGVFFTLSTKSIINDDRIVKLYNKAGLDRIQLSIDSFNGKTLKKLIGVKKNYADELIHMIRSMQKIGMDIRIKSVLTSINADEIDNYLENVKNLGIKHVQIVSYGRSGYRHDDKLFASDVQMDYVNKRVQKFKKENPKINLVGGSFSKAYDEPVVVENITKENVFKERVICNAGRFSMEIHPSGEVFICEHLGYLKDYVIGDLREEGIMECWNSEKMLKWLSPPSRAIFEDGIPCKTCPDDIYNICHKIYSRCLRFTREVYGNINSPDIRCPYGTFEKRRTI